MKFDLMLVALAAIIFMAGITLYRDESIPDPDYHPELSQKNVEQFLQDKQLPYQIIRKLNSAGSQVTYLVQDQKQNVEKMITLTLRKDGQIVAETFYQEANPSAERDTDAPASITADPANPVD